MKVISMSTSPQPGDRYDGLPEAWSLSARETYAAIAEDRPDLDAVQTSTLYEAAALIATADAMQAIVDAEGLTTTGSQSQLVAHPLLSEIRLSRVQAMAALKALGISAPSSASAAGSALVAKRWARRGTPGRRAGE